jgi:uncharacterized protein YkwD
MRLIAVLFAAIAFLFVLQTSGGRQTSAALAQTGDGTVNCGVNTAQLWPDSQETALLAQINARRSSLGLQPFVLSYTLQRAALWKSSDMATHHNVNHDDSIARDAEHRLLDCGYPNSDAEIGEDLAAGYPDANATFALWQSSPDHYGNLINPDYLAVGLKRVYAGDSDQYGWYWTIVFASQLDWPLGG